VKECEDSLVCRAGFLVAAAHQQELAGAAFLAGSVFRDLDVVFMAFGKRAYLGNHQGITHSLPLSPLYALLIAWPLLVLTDNPWPVYLGALLGLWVHMGLDLTNTFRIGLFSPLTRRRFNLDAVFFIDASALYDDVRAVTRALSITSVDEDETGTTIVASDLAVRNFGGRFGQTRLRFDRDGKLIHEAAEI
jgi:membrane-bound metal-dependent hydrolase YbcI (DUF457 family)